MSDEVRLAPGLPPVPPLAVGTWSWGDARYWGYGGDYGPSDVVDAFLASVGAGLTLFDTAEVYGHGESEKILGYMARRAETRVVVATKFAPLRGRGGARSVRPALERSLRRLGLPRVDLYQLHWADRDEATLEALMEALADVAADGLVGAVGVSNLSASELREAHAALARRGVPLATQQVRYSLLHRAPETDGVLEACRELGVTLLAYSPLEQGVLTGRYGPGKAPSGPRGREERFDPASLLAAAPAVALVGRIGQEVGRPPEQVALNWLRAKGVVPVAGAKTGAQAARNAGALGWSLTPEQVALLDVVTGRGFRRGG